MHNTPAFSPHGRNVKKPPVHAVYRIRATFRGGLKPLFQHQDARQNEMCSAYVPQNKQPAGFTLTRVMLLYLLMKFGVFTSSAQLCTEEKSVPLRDLLSLWGHGVKP